MIGVYAGSFDPLTNGHIDIIKRAAKLVDKLVVAILNNKSKKYLFTTNERLQHLKEVDFGVNNIEFCIFEGMLVQLCEDLNASLIIRGIRNTRDYSFENEIYINNFNLNKNIETVLLLSKSEMSHISSSNVKEIASFNGKISHMIPQNVEYAILEKYSMLEE